MVRELLNHIPTWLLVLLVVGGSVGLAIGVASAIRRLAPNAERQFEEVADGLRVVYELLFALILAFVIASVLDKFNEASATVDAEANALSQMLRDNRAFPAPVQSELNNAIYAYVDAVTKDEWPAMRHARSSREAASTLDTVHALYEQYEPRGVLPEKLFEQALAHLDVVSTSRRERLGISTSNLPTILLLMLPIGAVLLFVVEFRPLLGRRAQMAYMGTLALVVSSTYLLTIVLDYPFSGDVSVSEEPLRTGTLAYLIGEQQRAPQPGDERQRLTDATLLGLWDSDAYGTVLLRRSGGEIRGAYRFGAGTIRGDIAPDGVFRGVWCEGTRRGRDAGLVEWHLVRSKSGERVVTGSWRTGYVRRADGSFVAEAGWNLHRLKRDSAADLKRRLRDDPERAFCRAP